MATGNGSVARDLWDREQALVQQCLQHPFVRGILSGKLAEQSFRFYVGQDALYLQSFARAYLLAAVRCPDWDGYREFYELAGGVLEELELHAGYAERHGVSHHDLQPAPSTRRYTDFLLATAWGSDSGTTAAAMAPCMRLYAYLGHALKQEAGEVPEHQYGDWIETYADPEFQSLAARLESLVDRYVLNREAAAGAYRYAMECELAFFEAAHQAAG